MHLFLYLFLLLLISVSIPVSLSANFSTLSITRVHNETLVCALVLRSASSNTSDLICTHFPSGETINYSSEGGYGGGRSIQYSALATADDFLCGITTPAQGKSSMIWWSFADDEDPFNNKRVYWGPLLAISAGDSHVCGLINGSALKCWRWQEFPDDISFKTIAVGGEFVCGITTCGMIKCFGNETDVLMKEPEGNFTTLAAGSHHACAVSASGNLTCWGSGAPKMDHVPDDLVALSLGTNITCILASNGTVYCWGNRATPPELVAREAFVSIEVKGDSVCGVLMKNYSVICWGSKNFENNSLVFEQVLPGMCAPEMSCPCNSSIPGTGTICGNDGHVICKPCTISLSSKVNVPVPSASPPPQNHSTTGGNNNRIRLVVITIGIAGTLLAASIVMVGLVFYKIVINKEQRRFDLARIDPTGQQPNLVRPPSLLRRNGLVSAEFTFRALHRATDSFAEGNKIGSGGFGTVYWGVLPDGCQAAIKRAHHKRRRHTENAFLSELALLSRVNHKHLVGLLGFCDDRGERILVVEYMPNGTLYDHLHRLPPSDSSPLFTSWTARLKIALDAARGIEYLHSYAVPGIIHRDIKSSNILLDSQWTAKVSDFGLSMARTAGTGASAASAGTVGYMDPEYYRLQELTEKSDVYSFGVVLLEIITGFKAVFKTGEDEEPCHVAEYVMPILSSGDIARLIDQRVPMTDTREEVAIEKVLKMAAQCVRSRGRVRPTMREVVMELEWVLGLCGGDEDEMVEVVLEVEDRGSTVSSMSAFDME
ncbi:hypothetical protein LUZ63_008948 [Rhynchospora breviuscula]|uniref:Protein kinase domain-containing protein n=1 Tax=Rhynchospora breviuscula TaxID=2022672 RepID=A0A9Q0HNP6_9POAL|nr:hypothetical protein LUZ63_008948 [Rhynchospora breviuscula]